MPEHITSFEATPGGLRLAQAILLYRTASPRGDNSCRAPCGDEEAFASIHAIEHGRDGGPIIAAGTPLTHAHLRQWAEALGRNASPEILPGNVLVVHADMLAWWTPAQVRPAYFALTSPPDGLKALSSRTIVPVPYPAHLFVATRGGLGVYALPASERPTADTVVLHSPILNVFLDGKLCWGNIVRPKSLTIAAIPEYEAGVFESWSTHPNPGQEMTITGRGGLVRLWDDLAARKAKRFPVRRLRPFAADGRRRTPRGSGASKPMTLGKLVSAQR
jgi:PRTRC genetic system protein B